MDTAGVKSQSLKCLRTRSYYACHPSSERDNNNLPFFHLFSSVWAISRWMLPAHIGEGRFSLFSLLIQMLISFRNALTDTLRNIVLPAVWVYFSPIKLTHKIPSTTELLFQFSLVQLLSHVRLFATPWTVACQASLSITNSWSLLKLMSIKSVMPSNYLILCHPLFSCLQSFPASGFFQMSQLFASGGQSIGFQL